MSLSDSTETPTALHKQIKPSQFHKPKSDDDVLELAHQATLTKIHVHFNIELRMFMACSLSPLHCLSSSQISEVRLDGVLLFGVEALHLSASQMFQQINR